MTAKEDFQREVKESREQAKAVVEGLNTLRAVVADLQAQLKAAANGLTAEEATQAAADLDAAQQEVSAALAGGGVTVPADPGEPVVVPASQG